MKEERHDKERWVILLGDDSPPIFWSFVREDLERVCAVLQRTCPTARVACVADTEEPRARAHKSAR